MEDEDVIDENIPYHQHLRETGFIDAYKKPLLPLAQTLNLDSNKSTGETIDRDVIEEVVTLRDSANLNLLFDEDIEHVDSIFANYELAKENNLNQTLSYMFKGKACALILTIGLLLYIYVGYYAFVFVTFYYACRTSEYWWKKCTRLKQLKLLMKRMLSNFSYIARLMKFISENESMLTTRFVADPSHRAFIVLDKVKADFVDAQQQVNDVLAGATLTLLDQFPLIDYVENPCCYICRSSEYYKTSKIYQLHNVYMLLQSQFLTRLIFSLIPNLLAKKNSRMDVVTDIACKVSKRFLEIRQEMDRKFKFVLAHGIYVDKTSPGRRLPSKVRRSSIAGNSMAGNVHELSNSLQFSVIKSRQLENCLQCNEPVNTEMELNTLRQELSSCLLHIEDILLVHKRNKTPSKSTARTITEEDIAAKGFNITELGYSSLDPDVIDDIFEGSTTTDSIPDDSTASYDDGDEIDILAKHHQKHVLAELKTRLKQQAAEWARREAAVLARKGMAQSEKPKDDVIDKKGNFRMRYNSSVKKPRYRPRTDYDDDVDRRANSSRRKYEAEKVRLPAKSLSLFSASVQQVSRDRMAASHMEESFCGSGENPDFDDDFDD